LAVAEPRITFEGNHPRKRFAGIKNPHSLARGVKAGLTNTEHARLSLILSVARQLPTSHNAGLDEHEKQVFWLRGHPTRLAFPSKDGQWLVSAFVARYSGTLPHGIRTRFPILP